MISIRVSTILSIRNPTGLIAAAIPSTSKMLKMLEPITFPSAISTSFFLAATMEVTSSGRLVPSATIVSPISVWLSPNDNAISDALLTTKSPPNLIAIIPPTIKSMLFHIGIILISSSTYSPDSFISSSSLCTALAFFTELIIQTR